MDSRDYPHPKKGIMYLARYEQGNARADRERQRQEAIDMTIKTMMNYNKPVVSYVHDDAYGVIDGDCVITNNIAATERIHPQTWE